MVKIITAKISSVVLPVSLVLSLVVANGLSSPASAETPPQETQFKVNQHKVDQSNPNYSPSQRLNKALTSIGSDSMGNLVERWAEAYGQFQPVEIKIENQGSASAPAALIEGSADIGPMARPMKRNERSGFIARYGFQPTQVRTAIAAVAIYVNKQNPLTEISFEQLNAIYSSHPKADSAVGSARADSWQAVSKSIKELPVVAGDPAIYAIGATADPYAFAYFRQQVLAATDLDSSVTNTGDVGSMLELISRKPNAIGFGLLTTPPAGVKILAVRRNASEHAVMPNQIELEQERYPLGRFLNVYVISDPEKGQGERIEQGVSDLLSFILSRQGQAVVAKEGLLPLSHSVVAEERNRIGLQ
jgi:phosphate transport system substrate-binding protein